MFFGFFLGFGDIILPPEWRILGGMTAANGFHPDLDAIPADVVRAAKVLTLNYPQNPTGAVETDELYERSLAWARKNEVWVLSDLAYSELYYDGNPTRSILEEWTERLRTEVGDGFPEKVTAFHDEMAVHGKYGRPCPVCPSPWRVKTGTRRCWCRFRPRPRRLG